MKIIMDFLDTNKKTLAKTDMDKITGSTKGYTYGEINNLIEFINLEAMNEKLKSGIMDITYVNLSQ